MFIKRICYPVTTLGPGLRIGIWVTGCKKNCPGCMSPELQSKEAGRQITVEAILNMLDTVDGRVDGVTISGGEPFLQPDELKSLVRGIRERITEDIIVYSGYTLSELKEQSNQSIAAVLENISVLIDGPYVDELNDGMGIRGSSNQNVHVFHPVADYQDLAHCKRSIQSFRYNNQILLIGIQ